MEIALNVGRSRLNILGLTLALYLFMTGVFIALRQEYDVRPVWVFLTSFVPIVIGFALTMASLLLFLLCQRLDVGHRCEIWSFSCRELLMYLALAQTLSGCLQNFVIAIAGVLRVAPEEQGFGTSPELEALSGGLSGWLLFATGLVWAFVIYVAPVVFLVRISIARTKKWRLAVGYVVVLLAVFWISAYPFQIKAHVTGRPGTLASHFVKQFWQPALWSGEAPDLRTLRQESTGARSDAGD
jgi:hypothetical protein